MLSFITGSYLAYKGEVDYKGFNELIRVTLASYYRSEMYGTSTSNRVYAPRLHYEYYSNPRATRIKLLK